MKTNLFPALLACALCSSAANAATASLEDVALPNEQNYAGPGGGRYWTGAEPPPLGTIESGFVSGVATFHNSFTDFGGGFYAWNGFAYSNTTDNITPGFDNQYSAFPGGGANGSSNYGVAYASEFAAPPRIDFAAPTALEGAWFTNTTYSALSMRDGDGFSKQFGGPDGTDPDWFLLTITGLDASDTAIGTVDFYLADFRFSDSADDFILDTWAFVALDSLGIVAALKFALSSSDVGAFGINTPTYFAIDNVQPVPVPAALWLFAPVALRLLRQRRCA